MTLTSCWSRCGQIRAILDVARILTSRVRQDFFQPARGGQAAAIVKRAATGDSQRSAERENRQAGQELSGSFHCALAIDGTLRLILASPRTI